MLDLSLLAAAAEHGGPAAEHAELAAFGLTPGMWVAAAMATLLAVMVWKKVPGMITSGLDASIAEIRKQLDEAKALRAEAEALRKEYADKIAGAEQEAAAMIDDARHSDATGERRLHVAVPAFVDDGVNATSSSTPPSAASPTATARIRNRISIPIAGDATWPWAAWNGRGRFDIGFANNFANGLANLMLLLSIK